MGMEKFTMTLEISSIKGTLRKDCSMGKAACSTVLENLCTRDYGIVIIKMGSVRNFIRTAPGSRASLSRT